MRRIALSVLTVLGLALGTGCSGGTGLNTGSNANPTSMAFTNGSGQADDFFVSPNVTTPVAPSQALQINVTVQKGSGAFAAIVPDPAITWAARYVTASDPASISTYTVGAQPSTFKTCSFLAATAPTPAVPLYLQTPTGLTAYTNGALSQTVYVAAVPTVPAPYCLDVQATDTQNGLIGHVTVVVSNSP